MPTDGDYELSINIRPLADLDRFASLACQSYNFGNKTDWFGAFRGGYYGLCSRLYGVKAHYRDVHSWIARPRMPAETEYHVSAILFGMESAIECFTFMLNALGYTANPSGFCDITDEKCLAAVSPYNIFGQSKKQKLKEGYESTFPTLQAHWQSNSKLIIDIMKLHIVSKHRQTIYRGGMARLDPPPGFYERLGLENNPKLQSRFWPHAEIVLMNSPKMPHADRILAGAEDRALLETMVKDFCDVMEESCIAALSDAKSNIRLKHDQFLKP